MCVSVCYHEICCLPRFYVAKFYRVLYGVFKVFVVWLSLKTLCSRVLVPFDGHRRLPRELSTDKRDSNGFFSIRKVYHWFITDHSTLAEKLLGYLSAYACYKLLTRHCTHDTAGHYITQSCAMCILVVTLDIVLGSLGSM